MILGKYIQQPAEVLDYDFDFSDWLPTQDKIASAAASVTSGPDTALVLGATLVDSTGKIVKQWVSGGTNGATYEVQVTATTLGGRVKEAEFQIRIKEY